MVSRRRTKRNVLTWRDCTGTTCTGEERERRSAVVPSVETRAAHYTIQESVARSRITRRVSTRRTTHLSTLRGRGCVAAARGLCDAVLADGGAIIRAVRVGAATLHHLIRPLLLLIVKLQQLLFLLLQLLLLEPGLRQPRISFNFYHTSSCSSLAASPGYFSGTLKLCLSGWFCSRSLLFNWLIGLTLWGRLGGVLVSLEIGFTW